MNSFSHFSSSSFYLSQNDQNAPSHPQNPKHAPTPIESTSSSIPIPVQRPTSALDAAAIKIQSTYRSHLARSLVRSILAVDSDADRLHHLIRRQETVDSIRSDERERPMLNESLMGLLLRLDSVPGSFDPNVRELRRTVSRRIVGLQEIADGIAGERLDGGGGYLEGLPGSCEELLEKIWAGDGRESGVGTVEKGDERRRCPLKCLDKLFVNMWV